jgi:hypothetical protein
MEPTRVNRILEDWNAVASQARRPAAPPRGVVVRSGLPGATLAGAGLVVIALVLAGILLGRQDPNGIGGTSSPSPSVALATPSASPSALTSPESTPTPAPTTAPCTPDNVAAAITMWEGAAGHRIAHVEVTNDRSDPCLLETMARPQLVDGNGTVLIDGASPPSPTSVLVNPGDVLRTLVQAGNYCGPAPARWVSVAFLLSDGGLIVASPLSPTDATVPPCLGAAEPATIDMQPLAP